MTTTWSHDGKTATSVMGVVPDTTINVALHLADGSTTDVAVIDNAVQYEAATSGGAPVSATVTSESGTTYNSTLGGDR